MIHLRWQDVPGWFDFQEIYDQAVKESKDGDTFVEVGVFLGRSTLYLAEKVKESGKRINLYAVDLFDHKDWEGAIRRNHVAPYLDAPDEFPHCSGVDHYTAIRYVLTASGMWDRINLVHGASLDAAKMFSDHSLRFVFLDADHGYQSVREDLAAWSPKVMPGGILAGHDYVSQWPGVIQAVNERFQYRQLEPPSSWKVRIAA